ncbi:hypothetical protein SDC9_100828 [bioreactor metagenome]|uniref:Uncharacterized protein n=1 Tax=bioreactor metagenome TaxID=1076179 RepID=A0A645ALE1_9ZZZZ
MRPNAICAACPFLIYYKGIIPEEINVDGRNSLDLAPTVMDYLDISVPNYFLGESLFSNKQNTFSYDTIFWNGEIFWDTSGENISYAMSSEQWNVLEERINKYFIAKTQKPSGVSITTTDLSQVDTTAVSGTFSPDYSTLDLRLITNQEFWEVTFLMWSDENSQDDLQRYNAVRQEDGSWTYTVNMADFHDIGTYRVQAFTSEYKAGWGFDVTQLPDYQG